MSIKLDWKKTLATVAPALATALGGPMAGVAVAAAGQALGLDNATEEDLKAAVVGGSPDTLLKLKQVDAQFKTDMKQLDVDIERIAAEDRGSARAMSVSRGFLPQIVLATIFTAGFLFVLHEIFSGASFPPDMREPAMYVLGILSAGMIQIMNFFFGSSAGSKSKTDALAGIAGVSKG